MDMTEELFREDAYLQNCMATVTAVDGSSVRLDRTVFYPMGGGQPGDRGQLLVNGAAMAVLDTRKGTDPGSIDHVLGDGSDLPEPGSTVEVRLDWPHRHRLMRMHTCLHLLCRAVDGSVNVARTL